MLKDYWNKRAACLGLSATLVAGASMPLVKPNAATICRELNLAGISLPLEEYITEAGASIVPSVITTSGAITSSAITSSAVTASAATASAVTEKKQKKKKVKVAKQFRAKAISIASDYVNIRKAPNTDSKILGKLYKGNAANVIKINNGWVKIQSGEVTGYIKKSYLAIGKDAQKLSGKYGRKLVSVKKGVVTLNVREEKSTKATILTQIPEDEMYDVARAGKKWAKIVIDEDTKGFVSMEYVKLHVRFKHAVSIREEQAERARKRAAKAAEQQRLASLSQSRTSRSASSGSSQSSSSSSSNSASSNGSTAKATGSTGSDIANYALNFVGNEYKWGGTSLTNGADCSGFVQSIYAQYGYSIPRTSREQSTHGKKISLSSVQPGDLIFYKHGSTVGHVALYIGGGRVVHAASSTQGIITSSMNYNQPYCARRIV